MSTVADHNPLDAAADRDVFPALRRLRRATPVVEFAPELFVVTRYADVRQVLLDDAAWSTAGNFTIHDPDSAADPPFITQSDPPRHTDLRRIELGGFSRGPIREAEPWIAEKVTQLVEGFADRGEADIVQDLALPLTAHVIARLVGVPDADASQLARWVLEVTSRRPYPVHHLDSWKSLEAYLGAVMAERQHGPRDDMISRLLAATVEGQRLDPREVVFHSYQLFSAGTETTAYTIGWTVHHLLSARSRWEQLIEDPSLVTAAREEGLRHASALRNIFRQARVDTEVAGTPIPTGARVVLSIESANHDERVYDDPDTFRLDRGTNLHHLAFGFGIHACLGAALGRAEIELCLHELLRRLPGLRLASPQRPPLVPSGVLNGFSNLRVQW